MPLRDVLARHWKAADHSSPRSLQHTALKQVGQPSPSSTHVATLLPIEKTERLMPSRMGRTGNVPTVIGRANLSHDVITNRERPPGSFDIVHLKDANGNSFAMKIYNILGNQAWISLPRRKGIPG
nr:40S ribosomal protein S4, Y-like isoform X2 [Equus asinus]